MTKKNQRGEFFRITYGTRSSENKSFKGADPWSYAPPSFDWHHFYVNGQLVNGASWDDVTHLSGLGTVQVSDKRPSTVTVNRLFSFDSYDLGKICHPDNK